MERGERRLIQRDFKEWKSSEDQYLRDWGDVRNLAELSAALERPEDRVRWRMENVLGLVVNNMVRHKTATVNMLDGIEKSETIRGVRDLEKFKAYVKGGGMFSGD